MMRRFLLLLLFLVPLLAYGQGNAVILQFPGAPTGNCAFVMMAVRADTGALYACSGAGNWVAIGPTAAGAVALSSVLDPATNKSFTMGASTLGFNWTSNTSTANMFSVSDFATNTGTGYLFTVSTGSSSASKVFRVCSQGTSNCVTMDSTTLQAIGTATIAANSVPVGGVTGLGTGIATWLATPSSANLAAAMTDETGTGAVVFGTQPSISKPVLTSYTVATLPTPATNMTVVVTDGASGTDCTTGSGSAVVWCRYNGSAWAAVASTGGGTTTNALTINNSGSGDVSGTTFNGSAAKTISYNSIGAQQALTLTTTGTSGAATLVGGTLNIPQYTGSGSGCIPAGSANGILLDSGAGTCPTSTASISSGNISTPGTISAGVGGSVAGGLALTQGTANTLGSNQWLLEAPTGITTSFGWTLPTGENASAGLLHVGAASTHKSALTISAVVDGDISGQVGVAHGGTGLGTLTAHALYAGNGTSAPNAIGPDASSAKALFSAGSSADPAFRSIATTDLPAATRARALTFPLGYPTNSSALTTSDTIYLTVPFACTISAYNIVLDSADATIKFKVWKVATGTAIPTVSNSISTSGWTVSTGTALHSTTVSDLTTTTVSANDIMAVNVATANTAKYAQVILQCDN